MVNYELGLKWELSNRKSTPGLSIFKINSSDMQVTILTPDARVYYTVNAGKVTSEGLEFAATHRLGNALHLAVNAAYTDAFATQAVPAAGIFVGTRLPSSPKWTAAAMLDYSMRDLDGWTPQLSASWRSTTHFRPPLRLVWDKDLLALDGFQGIAIIKPGEFWRRTTG
jgi:iron complex outermembrane recepter protein